MRSFGLVRTITEKAVSDQLMPNGDRISAFGLGDVLRLAEN
jgi:hypothetical protein